MSKLGGRIVDDVKLWSEYVEFPSNFDSSDHYLPLVVCPNPSHDTVKRHFQINTRDGLVHCFANCGISGSYQHALCVIHGLYGKYKTEEARNEQERKQRTRQAFREARKLILRNSGIKTNEKKAIKRSVARADGNTNSERLEYESYIPLAGIEFLESRGITGAEIATWKIGWDSEELRIVIPGNDLQGRTKLLIKRATKESQHPKYLYTAGFPKSSLLFGACNCDLELIRSLGLVIVEGSIDTILQHKDGWRNTVATLGTGISNHQVRIIAGLRPKAIFLFFDKDAAGIHGIEIAERKLKGKYPVYVVRYPNGKFDPAELERGERERAMKRAIPLRKFKVLRQSLLSTR